VKKFIAAIIIACCFISCVTAQEKEEVIPTYTLQPNLFKEYKLFPLNPLFAPNLDIQFIPPFELQQPFYSRFYWENFVPSSARIPAFNFVETEKFNFGLMSPIYNVFTDTWTYGIGFTFKFDN
jgi:hypothetical protein